MNSRKFFFLVCLALALSVAPPAPDTTVWVACPTHPELQEGEVFLGNVPYQYYHQNIGWSTKRLGKISYNIDGIANSGDLFPVFVQEQELLSAGIDIPNYKLCKPGFYYSVAESTDLDYTRPFIRMYDPFLR